MERRSEIVRCGWYSEWLCEECDWPECASYIAEDVEDKKETENKQLNLFDI